MVSVTPRPQFTPVKEPVLIVQEAGWAPGSVWTGAENLAPTGIRSPGRPARRQSLHRLSYPAHSNLCCIKIDLFISTVRNVYNILYRHNIFISYVPYILESNPHPFYSFRGLKIRCGLQSRAD